MQFITVQIERTTKKGSKVIGKLSSLWHSSILWHSLETTWIIIRYVLTYFNSTTKLHNHITVVLNGKVINKVQLFHVRLFGLRHVIVWQTILTAKFALKLTSISWLPSTLQSSLKADIFFYSVWLFFILHNVSLLIKSLNDLCWEEASGFHHVGHTSPLLQNHTLFSNTAQFRFQVAWIRFRPADGIRNIHVFSGDKVAPPVVLLTSYEIWRNTSKVHRCSMRRYEKKSAHNNILQSLRSAEARLEQTVLGWGDGAQSAAEMYCRPKLYFWSF